jgi:stage II sporulation protein P
MGGSLREEKMNIKHSRKIFEKPYFKLLMVPLIVLIAFLAVMTGIKAGDLLYRLDVNLVENIDSETFRETIKFSLPIIENVYNNGKSSTSFAGEIKNLFTKVFEIDLDSPMSILNVQSPLFMSYYNNGYKSLLALDGNEQQSDVRKTPGTTDSTATEGIKPNAGEDGTGIGTGTGTGESTGAGTGGTDAGTGGTGTGTGSTGMGIGGTDPGAGSTGTETGKTGTGQDSNFGKNSKTGIVTSSPKNSDPLDLQPISSITYEAEDEEENDNSDTVALDKVVVQNFTKHKIDIVKLLKQPLNLKFDKKGPKVLIYHTHTSESYVLKNQDLGKKGVASYNSNPKYNVVRVGEELSRNLKKYGIETLHNATVHDKVRNAAYGVAIDTLKSYKQSYPSIKVFIDLHRDGLDASKPKLRMVKKINGKNAAQIMFVMGTNDMLPHPKWEENLKFALKVEQRLNEKYPGLARPVWIVGKRYNQQVSNQAVLIEVGGDGNLLSECTESMKYLAEALNDVIKGK